MRGYLLYGYMVLPTYLPTYLLQWRIVSKLLEKTVEGINHHIEKCNQVIKIVLSEICKYNIASSRVKCSKSQVESCVV